MRFYDANERDNFLSWRRRAFLAHHTLAAQRAQCNAYALAQQKMVRFPKLARTLTAQENKFCARSMLRSDQYKADAMSYYAAYRAAVIPAPLPAPPHGVSVRFDQPRREMNAAAQRLLDQMLMHSTPLARRNVYYNDNKNRKILRKKRVKKCPPKPIVVPPAPMPPWGPGAPWIPSPGALADYAYETFAGDCILSPAGDVVPGSLDGPSNIGHPRPLRKNLYQFDYGITKTFAMIEFPHAYAAVPPLEILCLDQNEQFYLGELERCLAYAGHHATTAHTFLHLHFELVLFFARMGGFSRHATAALADGAVDAAHLVDFRSGNAYDGYMSPLLHRVHVGRGCFDEFETLVYSGDSEHQRTHDARQQGRQMANLGPLPGMAKTVPQHSHSVSRWTSVTPNGLLLPGHDPQGAGLHVDIQVKSFSGADQPLIQEAGIDLAIFRAVQPIFLQGLEAGELAGQDDPRSADAFVSQSTIFAVRIVASICMDGYRHRQFTLARGGWVAPPRHARFGRMHRQQQQRQQQQQAADCAPTPAQAAGPTDTSSVSAYNEHFIAAMNNLHSAAVPPTLADEHRIVRVSSFHDQLSACLAKEARYTPPTMVHPGDVRDARDLPRAQSTIYLRDNPACDTPAHRPAAESAPSGGADLPEPPVWQELADPTLEDVLWLAHTLMTSKGMRYFPRPMADCGINWDMVANRRHGQQETWAATNAFVSPAPMTAAHSQMLYHAYASRILDAGDLHKPAAPRPPPSSLLKPALSLRRAPLYPIPEASWDGSDEMQMHVNYTQARHMLWLYHEAERHPE